MIIPKSARKEVNKMLSMYATYKQFSNEQSNASRMLAKARLKNEDTDDLEKNYKVISQQMQDLSLAMTFATPLIWAVYKFEAYANEAQPIRTMQDFRLHCSKPGYICTKRFLFVNKALNAQNAPDFTNTTLYPDQLLLTDAFDVLHSLSQDKIFTNNWNSHEYYKVGNRVAKWENFDVVNS